MARVRIVLMLRVSSCLLVSNVCSLATIRVPFDGIRPVGNATDAQGGSLEDMTEPATGSLQSVYQVLLRRASGRNGFSTARRNASLYRMMRPREGFKGWFETRNVVDQEKTSASSAPSIHARWNSPWWWFRQISGIRAGSLAQWIPFVQIGYECRR